MYVQARAGRIYVDDAGTGERPLIFVHSLAGNSQQWAHQLEHVRGTGCAVAYDQRGHGRSDPPEDKDYTLEAGADDLLAVVDAVGIDQFILVAHSMGAGVASVFAATYPHRVRGLLLVDPVGDQRLAPDDMQAFLVALDTPRYEEIIRDYWTTIAGPDPVIREQLLRDLERTPRAAVVGMLYALQRTNLSHAILAYRGPKRAVVTPHNDFFFSLHNIDPALKSIVLAGTGHWLFMEKPAEFNRIMDAFVLEALAQRAPG